MAKSCAAGARPRNWKSDGGHDRAAGVGHGGGLEAAAGDDAGDVRAVAVGVNAADRHIEQDPALQVGMVGVHAGVIDVDEDIAAGQAEVVVGGDRVGGDGDAGAAQVIGQHAGAGEFDLLHAGKARARGRAAKGWRPALPGAR